MDEFRILSPTAILGYGFPESSFQRGIKRRPDLIGVDAGSSDPGPYYLGAGKSFTRREAVKRDLEIMLCAAVKNKIPVVIGTAGGSGAAPHVQWTADIIREIAREQNLHFTMGVIHADIDKSTVAQALRQNKITPLGPIAQLTEDAIRQTTSIVAQMGQEPVFRAFDQDCQVVLCGRCYDPVAFAARPVQLGFPAGLACHLGKILECAAIAATPGSGADCVLGTLEKDRFVLEALNPDRRFTRISTAAHTLYEKENPYLLHGPDGCIDLNHTEITEIDEYRAAVSGTEFIPSEPPTVKLEGASREGYRSIFIAGVRDPVLVQSIRQVLDTVKNLAESRYRKAHPAFRIIEHIYGINGVMGTLEPVSRPAPHEIGLVVETIAESQQTADSILSWFRSTLLHYGYPGRISTAGNLALLYSPSDISCGKVFRFSMHHLMQTENTKELFPLHVEDV